MPTVEAGKVMNEIEKESDFRKIATVIRAYKNGYRIFAKDCKDKAEFVAEGAAIPVYESAGDLLRITHLLMEPEQMNLLVFFIIQMEQKQHWQ